MPPAVHGFGTVIQRRNRFLLYYRLGDMCMGFNGSRGVYDFSDSEVSSSFLGGFPRRKLFSPGSIFELNFIVTTC